MTSLKKPSAKTCKICKELPSGSSYDVLQGPSDYKADFSRLEGFDMEKEEGAASGLMRCPLCHTFYLEKGESDPHHYMSYEMSISRITEKAALRKLTSRTSKRARQWLEDLNLEARIPELVAELKSNQPGGAAATLADLYMARGQWKNVEALLSHRKDAVNNAALAALTTSLDEMPTDIIDAVFNLAGKKSCAAGAHRIFTSGAWWGQEEVSPLITTLLEHLDNPKAGVRALLVDAILAHLATPEGKPPEYEPGKPPKLSAKLTKELIEQLPLLVRHASEPLPAGWVEIGNPPVSVMATDFPQELTTGFAALKVFEALIDHNKTSKAKARKALKEVWPNLIEMLSKDDQSIRIALTLETPIIGNEAIDMQMKQLLRPDGKGQ